MQTYSVACPMYHLPDGGILVYMPPAVHGSDGSTAVLAQCPVPAAMNEWEAPISVEVSEKGHAKKGKGKSQKGVRRQGVGKGRGHKGIPRGTAVAASAAPVPATDQQENLKCSSCPREGSGNVIIKVGRRGTALYCRGCFEEHLEAPVDDELWGSLVRKGGLGQHGAPGSQT